MEPRLTDEDLMRSLLFGEADSELVDELAQRASLDRDLAGRIATELEFSECLKQAFAADERERVVEFEAALESSDLSMEELLVRVREGSATVYECDQVVPYLWDSPERVRELRHRLAEDEWLYEALSDSKSETAFIESLETRMWAELGKDHFVDEFEKRLERELFVLSEEEETETKVVPFGGGWGRTFLQMAAAAAVIALGAYVIGALAAGRYTVAPVTASIVKMSPDAVWVKGASPKDDGTLSPGVYALKSGVVSMRLKRGGELTVEGPARFEVKADSSTDVYEGIALARVPEPEQGGTLSSRGLSISDSARLIGIDARNEGVTEAIVFNGDGGICLSGSGKCRELSEFEAVKADHLREKLVDVPYNPRAFSKTWAMLSGVEDNLGRVKIELPGSIISAAGGTEGEVRVFVENEAFRPTTRLEVDRLVAGEFAVATSNVGDSLEPQGALRSYLLQLSPSDQKNDKGEVETSLTFDHPVVGVIFSSDRLENSDAMVGSSFVDADRSLRRGLDSGEDEILLSQDRRTLNLRIRGGSLHAEQLRVLVALND